MNVGLDGVQKARSSSSNAFVSGASLRINQNNQTKKKIKETVRVLASSLHRRQEEGEGEDVACNGDQTGRNSATHPVSRSNSKVWNPEMERRRRDGTSKASGEAGDVVQGAHGCRAKPDPCFLPWSSVCFLVWQSSLHTSSSLVLQKTGCCWSCEYPSLWSGEAQVSPPLALSTNAPIYAVGLNKKIPYMIITGWFIFAAWPQVFLSCQSNESLAH